MFTGKNKEDFKKWLKSMYGIELSEFNKMFFAFKQGVYLEYLDSVGFKVSVVADGKFFNVYFDVSNKTSFPFRNAPTRQAALKEALKKADELINT